MLFLMCLFQYLFNIHPLIFPNNALARQICGNVLKKNKQVLNFPHVTGKFLTCPVQN